MVCEEESQGAEGFVNFLDNIFDAIFVKIAKTSQKHSKFYRDNTRFIFSLMDEKVHHNILATITKDTRKKMNIHLPMCTYECGVK